MITSVLSLVLNDPHRNAEWYAACDTFVNLTSDTADSNHLCHFLNLQTANAKIAKNTSCPIASCATCGQFMVFYSIENAQ